MNASEKTSRFSQSRRRLIFGIVFSLFVLGIIVSFSPNVSTRKSEPLRFEFLNDPDFADRSEWLERD